MKNSYMTFIKGLGAGMVAGAAVYAVSSTMIKNNKNIGKGSAKLAKAVGEFVDGVQTIFH